MSARDADSSYDLWHPTQQPSPFPRHFLLHFYLQSGFLFVGCNYLCQPFLLLLCHYPLSGALRSDSQAMAARSVYSSSVPSLPTPSPKSPPEYPDLYGKRREIAKIHTLEREIGFLEDELKSVQSLQPVSICCKEISDFVTVNSDPLTPTCRTKHQRCRFWKWLCGFPCFNLSWLCCCSCTGCSVSLDLPGCCDCKPCNFPSCSSCCSIRKCSFFSCPSSSCCRNISCRRLCCILSLPSISCPDCCCCCCECKCSCKCSFPKCSQVPSCRLFTKSCCCNPCSLCCCF